MPMAEGAGAAGADGAGAEGAGAAAGVALDAPATSDSMSSSLPAITAIKVPTGDVPPSSISRFRSMPSPRATSSMIALSVSTSASTSPLFTASPSAFAHFTRRPSSIVGERASMNTLVAISPRACGLGFDVHHFLHGGDRFRYVGLCGAFEIFRVRHGDVGLVHANHGRIEIVEAIALDVIDDLRAHAADLPSFLHHDGPIRLAHGVRNGFQIHRPYRAQVDDVDADVLFRELVSGLRGEVHGLAVGHDRTVVTFPLQVRLSNGDDVLLVRHVALDVVQHLPLEKDHGVVVANRALEQPLGVVRRARRNNLESGDVRQPGLEGLRVLRRELQRRAVRPAEDDGDVELATDM